MVKSIEYKKGVLTKLNETDKELFKKAIDSYFKSVENPYNVGEPLPIIPPTHTKRMDKLNTNDISIPFTFEIKEEQIGSKNFIITILNILT